LDGLEKEQEDFGMWFFVQTNIIQNSSGEIWVIGE
jgi:hypothetical protein